MIIRFFLTECGGTFEADEGIIVSPHYPKNYDNRLRCGYLIGNGDPQNFIILKFSSFDIEGQFRPGDLKALAFLLKILPTISICH